MQLNPNDAGAHNNLGVILAALQRFKEAAFHFQEAVRVDPHQAVFHRNLGAAMHNLGRDREAISHCQRALRLDPDDPKARIFLRRAEAQLQQSSRTPKP